MRINTLKRLHAVNNDAEYLDLEAAITYMVPRRDRLAYICNRRPGPGFKLYVAFDFRETGRFNIEEYIDRLSDVIKQIASKSGIEPDSVNVINSETKTAKLVTDSIAGVKGFEYTAIVSSSEYTYLSKKNQKITNTVIIRYETFGCGNRMIISIGY